MTSPFVNARKLMALSTRERVGVFIYVQVVPVGEGHQMLRSVTTNVNEWNKHCTSSNTAGCPDELMVHSSSRVIHTCPLAWRTLFYVISL